MALLAGILRTEDLNAALTTFDPEVVEDAIGQLLATYQAERNEAQALFVQGETTAASQRLREAGIDEGQEIGPDGRPLETHLGGYYDVGFPLKRIGWAVGWNDETAAHMTLGDLEREVNAKIAGNARRHSREIMRALIGDNANYTYTDQFAGAVTVRRLANTDGTLYGEAAAEDNHYLSSGYANTAISATNNPFATLATEIREHFDTTSRIVAFVNTAQVAEIQADLTTFVDTGVEGITPANSTAVANEPGALNVPGDFLGIDSASGTYVYSWARIPASYVYAQAIDEPAPLLRRVPGPVSLQGFNTVAEERHFPFYKRTWRELFGYAVANRLVGAAMFIDAGAWADPTV